MLKILFFWPIILLLLCCSNVGAQDAGTWITNSDRQNYKKNVVQVEKIYMQQKQLRFYYNIDSLLAYEQYFDREYGIIRSKKDEYLQLTNNYKEINRILENFEPKLEIFAKVDSLMLENDQLVFEAMFENRIKKNIALLPVPVAVKFLNAEDQLVTNVRCYFISRRVCRDLICTTCITDFITNGCTGDFMMKVKENPFFDGLNPQAVSLMPGGYNMFVVNDSGKVVRHDFREFSFSETQQLITVKL
jgi:hypothetical protein